MTFFKYIAIYCHPSDTSRTGFKNVYVTDFKPEFINPIPPWGGGGGRGGRKVTAPISTFENFLDI